MLSVAVVVKLVTIPTLPSALARLLPTSAISIFRLEKLLSTSKLVNTLPSTVLNKSVAIYCFPFK